MKAKGARLGRMLTVAMMLALSLSIACSCSSPNAEPSYSSMTESQLGEVVRESLSANPIDANTLKSLPDEYYSSHAEQAYKVGIAMIEAEDWAFAEHMFDYGGNYEESVKYRIYAQAHAASSEGDYLGAYAAFRQVRGFLDVDDGYLGSIYMKYLATNPLVPINRVVRALYGNPALNADAKQLLEMCDDLEDYAGVFRKSVGEGMISLRFYVSRGVVMAGISKTHLDFDFTDAPVERVGGDYTYRVSMENDAGKATIDFTDAKAHVKIASGGSVSELDYIRETRE